MSKEKLFENSEIQKVETQKTEKNNLNLLKAANVNEMLSIVGLDDPAVKDALVKLKRSTIYGTIDGYTYEMLIKAKIYEYLRLGIARRIYNMMVEQASRNSNLKATNEDLLIMLSEMARLEIEFGLKPIIHVIPVANQPYVKADGYLYYAKQSKQLKGMVWEDKELDGGGWQSVCRITLVTGETYEGIASAKPNPRVPSDDPREKARTKAMRRALRRAFAIGVSDEPLEEIPEESEEAKSLIEQLKTDEEIEFSEEDLGN